MPRDYISLVFILATTLVSDGFAARNVYSPCEQICKAHKVSTCKHICKLKEGYAVDEKCWKECLKVSGDVHLLKFELKPCMEKCKRRKPDGCLWSIWSRWNIEQCSVTCGNGTLLQYRTRTKNVVPFGDSFCTGLSIEYQSALCFEKKCQRGCRWTNWNPWISGDKQCSVTCGQGISFQYRTRTEEYGSFPSTTCSGFSVEYITEACNETKCETRVCSWSDWTEWQQGKCSATCGEGKRTDVRTRDKIYMILESAERTDVECVGNSTEMRSAFCNTPCMCKWTGWTQWKQGNCSVSCGGGVWTERRSRDKIYSSLASDEDSECNGESDEQRNMPCNNETCDSCPPISDPRYGGRPLQRCCVENTWHWPLGGRNYGTEEIMGNKSKENECPITQVFKIYGHNTCGCVFDEDQVTHWQPWGYWSECNKKHCHVIHRIRFCTTEDGRVLDPSECRGSCGAHTETKQCCKELEGRKREFYDYVYNRKTNDTRSVGKRQSDDRKYPFGRKPVGSPFKADERKNLSWVISLKFNSSSEFEHICGGVILSKDWIITAAHCIIDKSPDCRDDKNVKCDMGQWQVTAGEWNIVAGGVGEKKHKVKNIYVHHEYKENSARTALRYENDIALIKLKRNIDFTNEYIQPGLFPRSKCVDAAGETCSKSYQDWGDTRDCFSTGWGEGTEGTIHEKAKDIRVLMQTEEENSNPRVFVSERLPNERELCKGYSGSPLMCEIDLSLCVCSDIPQRRVILGLNSFTNPGGCRPESTNYTHTSLVYHMKWIAETVVEFAHWGRWSECRERFGISFRQRSGFFLEYGFMPGDGPLYKSYGGHVTTTETRHCNGKN